MSKTVRRFHIIGGGIAGLAAAKFLKQKYKDCHIILYEAGSRLGGRCFSYYDKNLDRCIDNATHVVLSSNKETKKILKSKKFYSKVNFWRDNKVHHNPWKEIKLILVSIFNTKPREIAKSLLISIALKLFPFCTWKRKIYFSQGDLSENIIQPLSKFVDEIKTGWKLEEISTYKTKINILKFNHGEIKINEEDAIISALDAYNYSKIFGGEKFEFNSITNIFFRTSVPLTLPENINYIGTPTQIADWIFIKQDIVAATISNSQEISLKKEELARNVWKEIRSISGINAAFMPPYKIVNHHRATIKQDEKNNKLRPQSAQTLYKNLWLAGDWTMKNYPCCIETAILSAKRISNQL